MASLAKQPSLFPILLVNFVGTLGFSIVLPFLIFLVMKFGGDAVIYGLLAMRNVKCDMELVLPLTENKQCAKRIHRNRFANDHALVDLVENLGSYQGSGAAKL